MTTSERERDTANREAVRTAVRSALVEQLKHKPFRDVTIGQVARDAGLSRTAFYFYFRDKNDVFRTVAEEVTRELYDGLELWWSGTGPPGQLVVEAIGGFAVICERNREIIKAAVELSTYDAEFSAFYRSLVQRFIDKTADQLEKELAIGRIRELDPRRMAEALVWATERGAYRLICVEGRPAEEVANSLTFLWVHTLYTSETLQAD